MQLQFLRKDGCGGRQETGLEFITVGILYIESWIMSDWPPTELNILLFLWPSYKC